MPLMNAKSSITLTRDADQCLSDKATTALHRNLFVPSHRLTVSVERGAITLAGTVDWQFQKAAAARCICGLTYSGPLFDNIAVSQRRS